MSDGEAPLVVNGWSIYAHPVFLQQVYTLIDAVEARKLKDPDTYKKKNCSKRLAAIFKLITETIPANPASSAFRQGKTLGVHRKHWYRAKFFQQYRLFFRFDSASKVIVLAWVNDEKSLRAYGKKSDAYAVFKGMLEDGNPPDDFDALLKAAKNNSARLSKALSSA